jgi:hypothetical protein
VYDEQGEPVPAGDNRAGDGIDVWDAELIDGGPETGTLQPATATATLGELLDVDVDDGQAGDTAALGELLDVDVDDGQAGDTAAIIGTEADGRAGDTADGTEADENADVWDTELIDDDPGAATMPRFVVVVGEAADREDDIEDDIEDLVVLDDPADADPEPTPGVPRWPAARVTAPVPAMRALRTRYGRHARQHPRRRPVRVAVGAGGVTLLLLLAAVTTIGADADRAGPTGNGLPAPDADAGPGSGDETSTAADATDRPGAGRDGQGSPPSDRWVVVPDGRAASSDRRTGVGAAPPSVLPVRVPTAPGPPAPSPAYAPADTTSAGQTLVEDQTVVAAPHYDPAPSPAPAPPPPATAPAPTYETEPPTQPATSTPPTNG